MIFVGGAYLVVLAPLSGMWYLLALLDDRSLRAPLAGLPCSKTAVFCGKPSRRRKNRKSPIDIKLGGF